MNLGTHLHPPYPRLIAGGLLAAMMVLSALSGTGYGPPVWCSGIAAFLAAFLLWPQLTYTQKRQALILASLGLFCFPIALLWGGDVIWINLLTQNTPMLGMLSAVSFLQLLSSAEESTQALPRGQGALWKTAVGVHLLGAVINLSVVLIMADWMRAQTQSLKREELALLSRAFLAGALWSPFFAATAIAMTYAPGANPIKLMLVGIALAGVLIVLNVRDIIRMSSDHAASFLGYPMRFSALRIPMVLALFVGVGHGILPTWNILSVVSWSSLLVVVLLHPFRQGARKSIEALSNHALHRLPNMAGELVLFLAAGCFACGLSAIIGSGNIWMPFSRFGVLEAAIVLAMMILLASLGIHTMISITMVATWLAPLHPEPTLLALVFVAAWAIGLAAAPTSTVNLAIQGKYAIPALEMARGNIRYCVQAYGAAIVAFVILGL